MHRPLPFGELLVLQTLFECDMTGTLSVDAADPILKRNAEEFSLGDSDLQFALNLLLGVLGKRDEVDEIIGKAAPQWPIEKIAPVDRNVLRLGIYELMFLNDVPPKVAINEAVEIGKAFGGENSGKFINGVMGTLYKKLAPEENSEN
jgi:N utilization substance protein B